MHIINFLSDHGANRQSGSVGNGFLSQFTEIVRLAAEQDAINGINLLENENIYINTVSREF